MSRIEETHYEFGADRCSHCGAPEIPATSPRTHFACGTSTYDGTDVKQSEQCVRNKVKISFAIAEIKAQKAARDEIVAAQRMQSGVDLLSRILDYWAAKKKAKELDIQASASGAGDE